MRRSKSLVTPFIPSEFAFRCDRIITLIPSCLKVSPWLFDWLLCHYTLRGCFDFWGPVKIRIFSAFQLILHGFQIKSKSGGWRGRGERLLFIKWLRTMAEFGGTTLVLELRLVLVVPEAKRWSFVRHLTFFWNAELRILVKVYTFSSENNWKWILDFQRLV